MPCHQWCNCSKCSNFYNECFKEIPNPYNGAFHTTKQPARSEKGKEEIKVKEKSVWDLLKMFLWD